MMKKRACPIRAATEVLPGKKLASSTWARLIAKVFLDDPLACPKCKGQMRIVSFVEQDSLIAKILKHLGLWESLEERPVANSPPALDLVECYEEGCSQLMPEAFAYEAC